MGVTSLPIIDSHIHLYPETHTGTLSWIDGFPSDHFLHGQHSVEEFRAATASSSGNLAGFVFIEADRKVSAEEEDWTHALDELSFMFRLAKGAPLPGEGHRPEDTELVLGVVPWAPVPAGPAALEKYFLEVEKRRSQVGVDGGIIKGVRYLVQSKPSGLALKAPFIEGLLWLGEKGYTFDLGVDAHSGGEHELREGCQMLEKVYGGESGGSNLKIVINHFCKPNLELSVEELAGHPELIEWSKSIQKMASFPKTYMKVSGLFSELPPQDYDAPAPVDELVKRIKPWFDVVLKAFGPSRIMFGSNWPIDEAPGPGPHKMWSHWRNVLSAILSSYELSTEDRARIWSGTAADAYNISKFASESR